MVPLGALDMIRIEAGRYLQALSLMTPRTRWRQGLAYSAFKAKQMTLSGDYERAKQRRKTSLLDWN